MKNIIILSSVICTSILHSQNLVSTQPSNKNVLLEEFTGVDCSSCVIGHKVVHDLKDMYPNRVFGVHLHTFVTGHTEPINIGEEDLRRIHPDYLWQNLLDGFGLPSGMINRKAHQGKQTFIFWQYPAFINPIDSSINESLNQSSPINIGLEAIYDSSSKILTINTETFATQTSAGDFRLNIYLVQSGIVVTQLNYYISGYDPNYIHNNIFREVLTPTWGEVISSNLTANALTVHQYLFDNTLTQGKYDMDKMEVIAFVSEHSATNNPMGEVVQVMGADVQLLSNISTNINTVGTDEQKQFTIFPNPTKNQSFWLQTSSIQEHDKIVIYDIQGRRVFTQNTTSILSLQIKHTLNPGVYFVGLESQPNVLEKLIIQ